MLPKSIYNEIKEGLKSRVYKTMRLVKKGHGEEHDEVIVPWNKIIKGDGNDPYALARLDYFKKMLDHKLDPGHYQIEVKQSFIYSRPAIFPVTVPEKKLTVIDPQRDPIAHDTSHYEQLQDDDDFMDKEEFKKMCRELETQRGLVTTLTLERDWYKSQLAAKEKDQSLSDQSSWQNTLTNLAKETVPGIVNLADKFLSMRETQLSDHKEKKDGKIKIKKSVTQINPQQVISYYRNLMETDPERGNNELDILEMKNPKLYDTVCEDLWPEEEELEEEYEEGEEEPEEEYEEEEGDPEEGYEEESDEESTGN